VYILNTRFIAFVPIIEYYICTLLNDTKVRMYVHMYINNKHIPYVGKCDLFCVTWILYVRILHIKFLNHKTFVILQILFTYLHKIYS